MSELGAKLASGAVVAATVFVCSLLKWKFCVVYSISSLICGRILCIFGHIRSVYFFVSRIG